ncbi:hypothetical protein [uncultured Clostridium sp.]|uniref:hypothetical protein n=1 Tax=uncultured Clostridium sp. TaxID=59620 RepID=UPI0026267043|nr:hypothetical protein [uncultured Clostridium sp.]
MEHKKVVKLEYEINLSDKNKGEKMNKERVQAAIRALNKLNILKEKIEVLDDEIEIIKTEYNSIKSINYSGISAKQNKVSVIEKIVINKEEQLLELYTKKAELELEAKDIERKLKKLNEKYRIVIEGRYGEHKKTWRQLANELMYSESYCRNKLIYSALLNFEEMLETSNI